MVEHRAKRRWRGLIVRRSRVNFWNLTLSAGVFSLSVSAAFGQPAPNARPTGGTVVAGQATISFGPGVVNITAKTPQAVIEWQSFDIGAKQRVVITGPSANATLLNRVIGPNLSQIAGSLDSNGQAYLVNASGVTYDQDAEVDASGFVSTSTNITNQNFMSGQLIFDHPGYAGAIIANQGEISVSNGGIVAFVAPSVSNSGVLLAPSGHIALGSANTFQLDPNANLAANGEYLVDITSPLSNPIGSDLVVNTGKIRAQGGNVELLASLPPNLVGSMTVGGVVRAKSVNGRPGAIIVLGTGVGAVVAGTLDASSAQAGVGGGEVQVVGGSTELTATSVVDVSGEAGGGTAAIGTDLARANGGPGTQPTQLSNTTLVDQGAQVAADALAAGNGGRVVVLASAQTTFAGAITARGGNPSGNGGVVEVSGGLLGFTGTVDVSAPFGNTGTLLLDPSDFIITPPIADALSAHLTAGGNGQLIIQADHDIEVDATIDGRGGVPGMQLIFVAGNQVRLNTDVFTNNAPVEIDASAGGVLASPGRSAISTSSATGLRMSGN